MQNLLLFQAFTLIDMPPKKVRKSGNAPKEPNTLPVATPNPALQPPPPCPHTTFTKDENGNYKCVSCNGFLRYKTELFVGQ